MNSHSNPTKMTGSPCSCAGSSKPCKCGGAGGCDCGGVCQVDTMVRPRFFAGQLLTEDDLQSLEDYVLAKNRLHNRHLFGAGVVCGLEVLCDPCGDGHVAVQPGYALDCCGNDIALDCRISLDINALVRSLRRDQLGGHDCGDPCTEQQLKLNKSAETPPREYCLYVRYCEQESDPVSPYAVDEPCSAQTCEPSRIREGIRFELRCPPPDASEPDLLGTIKRCFGDVVGLEKISIGALSLAQAQSEFERVVSKQTFDELRARLLDLIDRSPHLVRCKLRDRVLGVQPPAPATNMNTSTVPGTTTSPVTPGAPTAAASQAGAFKDILIEILRECICMALNPPCAPCDDAGVLLACLKVKDCEVIEICNLHRRFVMTPIALRYWSSFGAVERFAERLCCGEVEQISPALDRGPELTLMEEGARATPVTETQPMTASPIGAQPALQLQALTRALAGMSPKGSVESRGFAHMAEAFATFAGEKIERSAKPPPDLSDAERKAIEATVAKQVKAEVNANMEETLMASDPVKHLQTQIDDLKSQLVAVGKRIRKPPRGEPQ